MSRVLVFDNTPLSHFARARKLTILEKLVNGFRCLVPVEVRKEIVDGITKFPDVAQVLSTPWLESVEMTDVGELVAFASYKTELGGGPHENSGEAAVLAWVKVNGGVALVDERAGSRLAQRDGLEVHGSLWLVIQGLSSGVLNRSDAEQLVDDLRATDMRLPVDGEGFFSWAYQEGLLP